MSEHRLKFNIYEEKNPYSEERLNKVLELFFSHSLGKHDEMCLDLDAEDWTFEIFDKNKFVKTLRNTPNRSFKIISSIPNGELFSTTDITFSRSEELNHISATLSPDIADITSQAKRVESFLRSAIPLFPKITRASAGLTFSLPDFYKELGIKRLFPCFLGNFIHWINIIGPLALAYPYDTLYEQEDLLNAPAYQLEECVNGVLFMKAYENPFEYNTPENRERIIKLNNYLFEKANKEQW